MKTKILTPFSTQRPRAVCSGLVPWLLVLVTAVLALAGNANAALRVSMMPSYDQNAGYANAALNQAITVWGRAWGGTAPYSYTLSFSDGTASVTGSGLTEVVASKEISAAITFTSSGDKVATLRVTDNVGAVVSRSAKIHVINGLTRDQKVNMAIEKGLLYQYRNKLLTGGTGTLASATYAYWLNTAETGIGITGFSLMAFGENGHSARNDYVEDIYAETMQKAVDGLTLKAVSVAIGNQTSTVTPFTVVNPDANGNGKGLNVYTGTYANSIAAMGIMMSFHSGTEAKNATIPTGLQGGATAGISYFDFMVDMLDQMAWSQLDGAWKGWHYQVLPVI